MVALGTRQTSMTNRSMGGGGIGAGHAQKTPFASRREESLGSEIETEWLSSSDAESLIAAIWLVLEEHNMPRPAVAMQFDDAGLIKITIDFQNSPDAEKARRAVNRRFFMAIGWHTPPQMNRW
jgi:hypothetical protein